MRVADSVPVTGGGPVPQLPLPHGADRIEVMGKDAAVFGKSAEDLLFTGVALGSKPELVQRLTLRGASQGEQRSHGFFYRANGKDGRIPRLSRRRVGPRAGPVLSSCAAPTQGRHRD